MEYTAPYPGLIVAAEQDRQHPVREWLTGQYLYDVGGPEGCGCIFSFEPHTEATPERQQAWSAVMRQLAQYLAEAVAHAGPIQLYTGWDWWEPPLIRRSLHAPDLADGVFVFEERDLVHVLP